MLNLRDRPIRQKIMLVIMLISGVVLLLAFAALFYFQAYTLRQQSAHELAVVGEITAHNCAAAIMFQDEDAAAQILSGLKTMPQIVSARLELMDRRRLAFFGTARDESEIKSAQAKAGFQVDGNRILLAQPVLLNGKREGMLYLLADLQAMTSQLLRLFGGVFAVVLAASLLCAFVLSSQFQRFITYPILRLAGTARAVADHKDYSVRAEKMCGDELGVLTDAFNQMLAQIQAQEAAQARLTAILEATPDFVGSANPNGAGFFYLNRAARQTLGVGEDEDLGQKRFVDIHPEWAATKVLNEGMPAAIEHGSWSADTAIITRSGQEISVSQVLIAHKNPDGELRYFSTIMRDMTERRLADQALRDSQQRLVETSRLAGMAEVATGVLHNVGNVLNSVNVSAGLVVQKLRRSKAPKVGKAAALLSGRNGDLADYLNHDENGKKLPGYLTQLGEFLVLENEEILREVDQLGRNIEHIKEVVAMQQSYAKVSGALEDLPVRQLVDDAIAMNTGAFERHGVVVQKRYSEVPLVRVDRHKVLQILINLIRNAKYALDEVQRIDKRITISISATDDNQVCVLVADNGVGISPENLTRIFAHGFTTRADGHGFGLHSGALAAHSMGGSLSVASLGVNRGATFTLQLPVAPILSTST